jgi:hypothetical protein
MTLKKEYAVEDQEQTGCMAEMAVKGKWQIASNRECAVEDQEQTGCTTEMAVKGR